VSADFRIQAGAFFFDLLLESRLADDDSVLRAAKVESVITREAGQVRHIHRTRDEKCVDRRAMKTLDQNLTTLLEIIHEITNIEKAGKLKQSGSKAARCGSPQNASRRYGGENASLVRNWDNFIEALREWNELS
jgi:hypothetical protein